MICLRSGYCCTHYDVIIVDDPDLGITENNLKHKESGTVCQHLRGASPGKYECSIHDREWYKGTPCFDYSQIGSENSKCRLGQRIIDSLQQ